MSRALTPSEIVRIQQRANYYVWAEGQSDRTAIRWAEIDVTGEGYDEPPVRDIDARCQPEKAYPERFLSDGSRR